MTNKVFFPPLSESMQNILGKTWIVFHVKSYRGFADTSKKHMINKLNDLGFFFKCVNVTCCVPKYSKCGVLDNLCGGLRD